MVSKLSTLSFALAVAGALGQTCTALNLTETGRTVVVMIEDFLNPNGDLQSDIADVVNNTPWASITSTASDAVAMATELDQIAQNFTFYQGEFNYCDYYLISEVFEQAIPTLIVNLQSLSSAYSVFQTDNYLSLFGNSFQAIGENSLILMNAVYSALPGCQNADQIVEAFNGLPAAVASYQQAMGLPSTIAPPAEPTPCPTSTAGGSTTGTSPPTTTTGGSTTGTSPPTTTTGGSTTGTSPPTTTTGGSTTGTSPPTTTTGSSTPTSPPTCKKQVGQAKRAN